MGIKTSMKNRHSPPVGSTAYILQFVHPDNLILAAIPATKPPPPQQTTTTSGSGTLSKISNPMLEIKHLPLYKKKVREKSRECHNYKRQPFPDPKRKRKPTNLNKHKPNKCMKSTKISSLFPKPGNHNTKRTEKHKNIMTHGKTYNKLPRRIYHKATKSKTNTGTTALERSVEQTTGGFKALLQLANFTLGPDTTLNTEIHKNLVHIKAPNSVNASKWKHKNQINHYNKQRRVLMANSTVCQSKWKPIVEPWRTKPKTNRQAPTHWLKFYEEAIIESEARTAVVQLKSEA